MNGGWRLAALCGGLAVMALVTLFSWLDRQAVVESVRAVTQTNARMIAAHGEVALGEAAQVAAVVRPAVEDWDLEDPDQGRAIHQTLRDVVNGSPRIRSAWIVAPDGQTRLDSWTYPSDPVDATGRLYYQRHVAGETGPVVSRQEVGAVSGATRFTYSVPILGQDGVLRAIIVVGVLASDFDALYAEALQTQGSMVGLYTRQGDVLAEYSEGTEHRLSGILGELAVAASIAPAGVEDGQYFGQRKFVAWHGMKAFPGVFAARAVSLDPLLDQWRLRTLYVALLGTAAAVLFALLAKSLGRVQGERERAIRTEMATMEVHHRMKNSLQMLSSLVRLRARKSDNAEVRRELDQIAVQLGALGEVQNLLMVRDGRGTVDLGNVLSRLCKRIVTAHSHEITVRAEDGIDVDSGDAGRIAILTNELVTNAMKHGDGRVEVTVARAGDQAEISIADGGAGLPADFEPGQAASFGMRTVMALVESLGGTLEAGNGSAHGGAWFRVRLPIREPEEPDMAGALHA
jgi:two-component system, sensor histidine kinase PdtaS